MITTMIVDNEILSAALAGYEAELAKVEEKIRDIRARLGVRAPGRPKAPADSGERTTAGGPAKRKVSAAARKRMAAAQRKRWAAVKKSKNAA